MDISIEKKFSETDCYIKVFNGSGQITWTYPSNNDSSKIHISGVANGLTFSIQDFRLLLDEFLKWVMACIVRNNIVLSTDTFDIISKEAHKIIFTRSGGQIIFEHFPNNLTIKLSFSSLPNDVSWESLVRGNYEIREWIKKGFLLFDLPLDDVFKVLKRGVQEY